jgi:hypothetical protein
MDDRCVSRLGRFFNLLNECLGMEEKEEPVIHNLTSVVVEQPTRTATTQTPAFKKKKRKFRNIGINTVGGGDDDDFIHIL